MLVLTRRKEETIVIGDTIEITVLGIRGDQVRLGIAAPAEIPVHRKEVYDSLAQANRSATGRPGGLRSILKIFGGGKGGQRTPPGHRRAGRSPRAEREGREDTKPPEDSSGAEPRNGTQGGNGPRDRGGNGPRSERNGRNRRR